MQTGPEPEDFATSVTSVTLCTCPVGTGSHALSSKGFWTCLFKETRGGGLWRGRPNLHPGWGPTGEPCRETEAVEGTTGGRGQAGRRGLGAHWQGSKGHRERPAAPVAGWEGLATPDVDQWRTGKSEGGMLRGTHRQPGVPGFSREADLSR